MSMRYLPSLRFITPAIRRYFITTSLMGFAIDGGVYAVLFNLFLLRLHYGPEQIGLVNATGQLTFALSCLPSGIIGGRLGSRRTLLIGLAVVLVGSVLLPFADMLPHTWQFAGMLLGVIVLYLGLALYFVNTTPFMMALIDAGQRNQVFSFQTALFSLSSFVGSLIGGFLPGLIAWGLSTSLEHPAPYRYALVIAGATLLIAIVALHTVQPDTRLRAEAELPLDIANKAPAATAMLPILGMLIAIALVRTLQVSGLAVTSTFFNIYLDAVLLVPTVQIGAIIALARLLGVPAALATAALTARFGNRTVVIAASLASAVSILPIALLTHWGAAGLSFIGVVGLSWIRYTASLVFFLELVPPTRRATASGTSEMASGICFTVMTFGGGYVIAQFGYPSLFLSGAALTALSSLVFWFCFRNVRQAVSEG